MGRKEQHHAQQPQPPPFATKAEFDRALQELNTLVTLAFIYCRRRQCEERCHNGETPHFFVDWDRLKKLARHPVNDALRDHLDRLERLAACNSSEASEEFDRYAKHATGTTPPKAA